MARFSRFGKAESARMKAETLVDAWKSAGYCLAKASVVARFPCFGSWIVERSSRGVYVKAISAPVNGLMRGGNVDSAVCGKSKLSSLTWWPIRSSAAIFAGLVKALVRKVIRRSRNSSGPARALIPWHVRRRFFKSPLGRKDRKLFRHPSSSQNLRNVLLSHCTKS